MTFSYLSLYIARTRIFFHVLQQSNTVDDSWVFKHRKELYRYIYIRIEKNNAIEHAINAIILTACVIFLYRIYDLTSPPITVG